MIARGVLVMKKIFLTACFMIVSGIFALGAFAGGKTEKVHERNHAVAATFDAMRRESERTILNRKRAISNF